ncbi:uncharacterized protein [Prorops nasuta]|uniref:uncharacterized protein n=1 Tax=Prorops nasuta TaxID=863751 RepID=UPI0034CF459E
MADESHFLYPTIGNGLLSVDTTKRPCMVNINEGLYITKKEKSNIGVAKAEESMKGIGVGFMEFKECNLRNVVHVPELSANLLSVKAITDNGGKVIFKDNTVRIQFSDKNVLQEIKTRQGLYCLIIDIENGTYEQTKSQDISRAD